MEPDNDTLEYSPKELCSRIAVLTKCIMDFWDDGCWGWAHKDVANLLNKSMLRWQTSLAQSLILWIDAGSEGELILAWANLGALVEGQLKLFLCVYYNDYRVDEEAIRKKKTTNGSRRMHTRTAQAIFQQTDMGLWNQLELICGACPK